MSDDDFMMDSDEEEYEFEFESDGSGNMDPSEPQNASFDNQYYGAKACKAEEPHKALEQFQNIIETADAEWKFKALKQTMKVFNQLGEYDSLLYTYQAFLTASLGVTHTQAELSLGKIISRYGRNTNQAFLSRFYQLTLDSLVVDGKITNERVWVRINLGNAQLLIDNGNAAAAGALLDQVTLVLDTSTLSLSSTFPLEVIAGRIQIHNPTNNFGELRALHKQASKLNYSALTLSNPFILATLSECAGKTLALYKNYGKAMEHFFTAFRNYDEIGHPQRKAVLVNLIITTLLSPKGLEIDPFQSNEVRPYASLAEFLPWVDLTASYQAGDIVRFNKSFAGIQSTDRFVLQLIPELMEKIREVGAIAVLAVFRPCRLDYLAAHLNVLVHQAEALVVRLITNGKVAGVKLDLEQSLIVESNRELQVSLPPSKVLFNCKRLATLDRNALLVVPMTKLHATRGTSDHATNLTTIGNWMRLMATAVPKKREVELAHAEEVKMEQAKSEGEGLSARAVTAFSHPEASESEAWQGFASLCEDTLLVVRELRVSSLQETLSGAER